jgi:opacity protein-like surface antigen
LNARGDLAKKQRMTRASSGFRKRLGLLTLTAALVAPPVITAAQVSSGRSSNAPVPMMSLIGNPVLGPSIGQTSYGLLLALDLPPSGYSVGPRVSGELMYGFTDLAPQLRADLGARASFAYHSLDRPAGFTGSGSLWLLEVVPDAKLRFAVTEELGVYGDVGLGLALLRASSDFGSSTDLAFTIQFGAGVAYAMTPNINLLGELRFDVYTKTGTGLFVAIPTVGVELH